MSKISVIVNPGFVIRKAGQRFNQGDVAVLDEHEAARVIANGTARIAEEKAAAPVAEPVIEAAPEPVIETAVDSIESDEDTVTIEADQPAEQADEA